MAKKIACFFNMGESTILVTSDMEAKKRTLRPIIKSDNERFKFNWLKWISTDRLIYSVYFPDHRGLGIGTTETRLFSLDLTRKKPEPKMLFRPSRAGKVSYKHVSQRQDNVISVLPEEPEHILMAFDIETPTIPALYKVNVKNGRKTRFMKAKPPIRDWLADRQNRVRAGIGYDQGTGERSIWVHNLQTDKWSMLWEYKPFNQADITPLGFALDPHTLYINSEHEGRQAIFTIDTRQNPVEMTLVAADPEYDIEGALIYSPMTNDAIGVFHGEAGGSRIYWNDRYKKLQQSIDRALPNTSNQLVGFSNNERQYIVYSSGITQPGTFYFGDRDKVSLDPIAHQYPELLAANLSGRKKVSYQARDGMEIEAYLTLPNNFSEQPIPAIIHPHGGPMSRDYAGFDYWAEFFSNRGYAVLQPNFRGSSGYGHQFQMQAVGQYGMAMQDDLVDGTKWLIEQGIADPNRICIVGASYGGYAAMLAASKTPDLYQCAVSFAGVSNLLAQRNKSRHFVNKATAYVQYGHDSKQLKKYSPINNVESIKIPLLLVHGDQDRVVDVDQSRQMVEVLEDQDKQFEYIELENGTHYLDKQQHRTQLFEAMDVFLARYLGGSAPRDRDGNGMESKVY